jgi:hypothetical protein
MTLSRHPPAGRAIPLSVLLARGDCTLESVWPHVHTSLFRSGTAALAVGLRIALDSLPAGSSTSVALPAYGCPNLAAAALWAGGTPTYYDLSRDTFAPEREILEARLASGNQVVVHVDAFGMDTLGPFYPQDGALPPDRMVHDLAQSYAPYAPRWRPRARYSVVSLGRAKPASLTLGGMLLATGEAATVGHAAGNEREITLSAWQCALRSIVYSGSLRPGLFGILSRVPQLRIGQTKFAPLNNVERLPDSWQHKVAATAIHAQRCFQTYSEQTAAMLRLAEEAGIAVPGAALRSMNKLPLWRVPVLCATAEGAASLASLGAHLGVSRLYGKSLPELMGVSREQAEVDWPNAVWMASRLVTLPTHGRLRARARAELRALLADAA